MKICLLALSLTAGLNGVRAVLKPGASYSDEPCPKNPYKDVAGWCGCFTPEDDCDEDGFPNCVDVCECDPTDSCVEEETPGEEEAPEEEPEVPDAPGAEGDPHFKTWIGEKFDFHGACDLVLLHTPSLVDGQDMDIHIRTSRIERMYSYISGASVQVGDEHLEVDGRARYWINGVPGEELTEDKVLSQTIAGYPIKYRNVNNENKDFIIYLGDIATVALSTWDGYVGVEIYDAKEDNFGNSVGLLGTFKGLRVGRDGKLIESFNEYGEEWQVRDNEPKLFHEVVGPQYPDKCSVPSGDETARRLSQSKIPLEEAQSACAGVSNSNRESCIFDVMATGNVKMARAYK